MGCHDVPLGRVSTIIILVRRLFPHPIYWCALLPTYFIFSSLFRCVYLRVLSSVQQWSATYKNYLSGYHREMPGTLCTYTAVICTSAGTRTSIPVSGTGHFGKLGTTSIPVSSIRVPYRTHHWKFWFDVHRKFRHRGYVEYHTPFGGYARQQHQTPRTSHPPGEHYISQYTSHMSCR